MQNGDEALRSIILAGQGILVKMLITLYTFVIGRENDKEKKKILVTPGPEVIKTLFMLNWHEI